MKHVVEKEKLVLAVEQVHIFMNECLIVEINVLGIMHYIVIYY